VGPPFPPLASQLPHYPLLRLLLLLLLLLLWPLLLQQLLLLLLFLHLQHYCLALKEPQIAEAGRHWGAAIAEGVGLSDTLLLFSTQMHTGSKLT
jgi:hypothetical protein